MIRRLFMILAGASLLLGIVAAACWVDARRCDASVGYIARSGTDVSVSSSQARLAFEIVWRDPKYAWSYGWNTWGSERTGSSLIAISGWDLYVDDPILDRFGFVLTRGERVCGVPLEEMLGSTVFPAIGVGVRHWFAVTVFGVLPVAWLTSRLMEKRRKFTCRCNKCGYDLRATPDRCPECGAIPAKVVT